MAEHPAGTGHNAVVTDDVERVLGRRPGDFATYATRAAATGVWAVDAAGKAAAR